MRSANLPSRVISACVTIAPSGESANLAISFPVFRFQTPTQLRVAVAAALAPGEMLRIKTINDCSLTVVLIKLFGRIMITMVKQPCLPYRVNLELVPINSMNLFKYVVNIPNFDCSVNRGSYDRVPVTDCQATDFNDPAKVGIKIFEQFSAAHVPYIQVLPEYTYYD